MRKRLKPYIFVYKEKREKRQISFSRIISILFILLGIGSLGIVAAPFFDLRLQHNLLWGGDTLTIPIPKAKVINSGAEFPNVLANSLVNLSGIDYTDAKNWFPEGRLTKTESSVPTYLLSIPKLGINKAIASFVNEDLSKSLVHYGGSGLPGKPGNAVVFGHSTLPQLFNPKNYKTIFATLHTLKIGDEILVEYDNVTYRYLVVGIQIVDPANISVLSQEYDDSYLTLITCTPPGTYWKRLIIKTKIKNIG